jgi:hypothetical protein
MSVIYKYNIPVADEFELDMYEDSKILTFQMNNRVPCIWAIVNTNFNMIKRYFKIIGTGHIFKDKNLNYIGTAQEDSKIGILVWHLFEVINE